MFQIRIHGRGGQGVVSAAEMISIAAFHEGKHAQAMPSFGSERMGAPVVAYVRIDDAEIELREPVAEPDLLIIQDPTLFHAIDVFSGLTADGYVLVNSAKSPHELGLGEALDKLPDGHLTTVPATELALTHLQRSTPNTVLLGALTALRDVIQLSSVFTAIREKFPGQLGELNVAAAQAAYDATRATLRSH